MSSVSLDTKTEQELVQAAQQDSSKFGKLYEHYHPFLYRFILSKVSSKEAAEDLTSQTFEKALKNIHTFTWQGNSLSAWLYQIAKRLIIDYYRANARHSAVLNEGIDATLVSDSSSLENQVETELSQDLLQQLIEKLPEKEKKVMYLKFYNGYTNKLISEITGLSETNIGTILYRSTAKIKQLSKF